MKIKKIIKIISIIIACILCILIGISVFLYYYTFSGYSKRNVSEEMSAKILRDSGIYVSDISVSKYHYRTGFMELTFRVENLDDFTFIYFDFFDKENTDALEISEDEMLDDAVLDYMKTAFENPNEYLRREKNMDSKNIYAYKSGAIDDSVILIYKNNGKYTVEISYKPSDALIEML